MIRGNGSKNSYNQVNKHPELIHKSEKTMNDVVESPKMYRRMYIMWRREKYKAFYCQADIYVCKHKCIYCIVYPTAHVYSVRVSSVYVSPPTLSSLCVCMLQWCCLFVFFSLPMYELNIIHVKWLFQPIRATVYFCE